MGSRVRVPYAPPTINRKDSPSESPFFVSIMTELRVSPKIMTMFPAFPTPVILSPNSLRPYNSIITNAASRVFLRLAAFVIDSVARPCCRTLLSFDNGGAGGGVERILRTLHAAPFSPSPPWVSSSRRSGGLFPCCRSCPAPDNRSPGCGAPCLRGSAPRRRGSRSGRGC